jgi:hypothetical protein
MYPSVYNHGFVNVTGRLLTESDTADYHVFSIFPVVAFGPSVDEAYHRLGVGDHERLRIHSDSMEYRKVAMLAVLQALESQGFPFEGIPEPMLVEYDALLQNSAIVMVTGPSLGSNTPIFGLVSVSFDLGFGTAGERRLGIKVPRKGPNFEFLDFHVHDGRGAIAISEDYSLLLSSRLWFVGGNHNLVEVKTLELSKEEAAWESQARRIGKTPSEARAQVLAIMQHVMSSFLFTGKEVLPGMLQKVAPNPEAFGRRMEQLDARIRRACGGNLKREEALRQAMRNFAFNPPAQEFSLVDEIFAYTGGLDPKTSRDLIDAKEFVFRKKFPFPERLSRFSDPDVPEMTVSVLRGSRSEFDSGQFLRRFSSEPPLAIPWRPHFLYPLSTEMTYGPVGVGGVTPPRISQTFRCDEYLAEYSSTFGVGAE